MGRQVVFWLLAGLLYAAIAVFGTWPVAAELGRTMPGGGGDTYTGAWGLWYFHRALWRADTSLSSTNLLFYPIGTSLRFHVQNHGAAILAEPLQLAGVSLPAVFSLSWLLTFVLTGLAGAFLGFVATGSRAGGLVAGALFMLCPFRTAHGLGQLELLGTHWAPLAAGLLLLVFPPQGYPLPQPSRRLLLALLAGMASAMSLLASFYLGIFLGIFVVFYLSWRAAQGGLSCGLWALSSFAAGALPLALPVALPFAAAVVSGQGHYYVASATKYPADLFGFVLPTYLNPLLGPFNHALTGGAKVWSGRPVEGTVGLGWIGIALAVAGWRHSERVWKVGAGIFVVLSLGTSLHVLGHDLGLPLPYVLMQRVPLLRGARVPSRFVIMVSMCLLPVIAAGVSRLIGPMRRCRAAAALTAILALGIAELVAIPYRTHSAAIANPFMAMAHDPSPGSVLTLPDVQSQLATYCQTSHQRPLANFFRAQPQ